MITFKNTDALNLMSAVKSGSVDLVLTDPPYIISRKTGFEASGTKSVDRFKVSMDFGKWDNDVDVDHQALMAECAREWHRVLRKGGTVVVWYDLWKLQSLAQHLEAAGFKQLRFIEWVKTNPVPLNQRVNYLTNAREVALVAVKGGKPTFNSKYDNGVYSYPIHRDGGKRIHPTQKPLGLTRELIRKHSNEGDTVLDCFAGSATHLIAADAEGRHAIGCERDAGYYKKANARIHGGEV